MAETETKPRLKRYVVLSDAIVVTLGRKHNGKAEYTRIIRGGVLNGNPESEQIQTFLSRKAIMAVKSAEHLAEVQADLARGTGDPAKRVPPSRFRQTARIASQAQGAPDDPVQPVIAGVEPVPAPLPGQGVDEGNLSLSDIE